MSDDIEARKIVRIYSFEAEQRIPSGNDAHALAHILSQDEPSLEDIVAPWRRFFEPWESGGSERDPLTSVLSIEAAKLQKQWLEFQRRNPKEELVDINASEPTAQGIIELVTNVGKEWQAKRTKGKRGKALTYFHRFCGTLDAHSNMLEVVPRGNEYVSIFSGTITSIIKASANHEQIAEQLAQALCAISEHVAECEVELELFRTEEMQKAVADLYAHIFLFLTDTLGWYMAKRRKRLLDSFNENFMREFESEIENIQHKSEIIKRKVAHSMGAEQRVTRLIVEQTRKDLRLGLEGIQREHAETRYYAQQFSDQLEKERAERREDKKHWANLHGALVKLLTNAANSHRAEDPNLFLVQGLLEAADVRRSDPHPKAGTMSMTREQLSTNSAGLEDFFDRDRVRLLCDTISPTMVTVEALAYLTEWTKSVDAHILCVAGPGFEGDELENPMSKLAAKFIDFATSANIPVVSYFCEIKRGKERRGTNSRELQGLIELTYAMIRQMVEIVLPEFQCLKDFSDARFAKLDGTAECWNETMVLLEDLREIVPGKVFCVIDGFQWLDDRNISEYLLQFVETLRSDNLKVLFTTAGQSRCLLNHLSRAELLAFDKPLSGIALEL